MAIDFSKLSDADLEALSSNNMSAISDEGLLHLSAPEEPKPEEELPERTWGEAAKDVGISAAKGILGVPQAVVGLADIAGAPFDVSPGKYLEEKGYDFEKNQKLLSEQYSPRQKAEAAALSKAEGVTGNILAAIENPSAVGAMLMESLPSMVAGGLMGKVAKVAAGLETATAAGVGEGLIGAGSAAADIRQETEGKELSGKGAISALGSGVGTGVLGALGSKLTTALGGIDADTLLIGGAKKALAETVGEAEAVTPGMFRRVVTSTLGEGVLEEAPQSAQEKMWQNYATDKPLLEGVEDAAIKGGLLGSIMGGTVGAISGGTERVPTIPPPADKEQQGEEAKDIEGGAPETLTPQMQAFTRRNILKDIGVGIDHPLHKKLMEQDFSTPEGIAKAETFIDNNSKKLPIGFKDEVWDKFTGAIKEPVSEPEFVSKARKQPEAEVKVPEAEVKVPETEAAPVVQHTPESLIEHFKVNRPTNFSTNTQVKKALIEQGVPEELNTTELQQLVRTAHNANIQAAKSAPPQEQPPQEQGEEAEPLTIDHAKLKSYDDALNKTDAIVSKSSKRVAKSFVTQLYNQGLLNESHLKTYAKLFGDKESSLESIMSAVVEDLHTGREETANTPIAPPAKVLNIGNRKVEEAESTAEQDVSEKGKDLISRFKAHVVEGTLAEAEEDVKKYYENLQRTRPDVWRSFYDMHTQAKRIKDEDKARAAEKYTPFKEGEDVAFSENVSPELRKIVEGWKKLLGIKERIYFTTAEDADTSTMTGEFATIPGQTGEGKNGSKFRTRNGNFVVTFVNNRKLSGRLETISHEMGHVLEETAFNKADVATKRAIRAAYNNWVISTKGKTVAEHALSLRPRSNAKEVLRVNKKVIDAGAMSSQLSSYWHSFDEWFADQTARWATTTDKPLTIVEKFFARLGQAFKRFYKVNREYLPSKTMHDWLDGLGSANIAASLSNLSEDNAPYTPNLKYSLSPTEQASQAAQQARTAGKVTAKPQKTPFYKNIDNTISNLETKYLNYDAKFINTLRKHAVALKLPWKAVQDLLLRASQSQTVQATAIAGQAAIQGDIKFNPATHNWEAVDGAHTMPNVRQAVEDIAKDRGESFATINKIFSDIMVAARIDEIYKKADKIKANIKADRAAIRKLEAHIDTLTNKQAIATATASLKTLKNDLAKYRFKNRNTLKVAAIEEHHMSRDEVAEHLKTLAANPEYQVPLDEWQGVRASVVDFLLASGRYSRDQADAYMDAVAYVPFQRIMHDRDVDSDTAYVIASGKRVGGSGLSAGQRERAMKGSAREVDDIISNMEKWVVNSYIKGIKAAKSTELIDIADSILPPGSVTELTKNEPKEGAVTRYRNGVKEYWKFEDPFMTFAFNGINNPLALPTLKFGAKAANKLRQYIVLNPLFTVSQLPQDTFAAMFSSGVKHPFALPLEVIKEFVGTLKGSTVAHEKLKAIGAAGQKDFTDSFASSIHDIAYGGDTKKKSKMEKWLDHFAMAGDNAVRQAVYNRTMKELKGNPNAEAIAQERAFELINFRRKGASASLDAIRQITPFFGAYLQAQRVALNVLSGRGIAPTERKEALKTLAMTTAQVIAFTGLYNMVVGAAGIGGDDEEESDFTKRNIKDRDRKLYIPFTKATLPLRQDVFSIPFILGNHAYQYMFEKGTKNPAEAWKAVGDAVLHTLPGIGMPMGPTIAKPIVEVAINHDFFTGRPIISQRLQGKDTSLQYDEKTSELAKMLGKTGFVSPKDVDHLVKGFFGYVGGGVLTATDMAMRAGLDTPYMDKGVLGKGIRDIPGMTSLWAKDYDSQDVDTYFKMRTEIDKAHETYNALKKLGKREEAAEYKKEHKLELLSGPHTQLNKMVSKIDDINEKIRKLAEIPNARMSPEDKRVKRDHLDARIRHIQSNIRRIQKRVYPD